MKKKYIIAIDFDATLTIGHMFPEIGKPRKWLIDMAIKWRKNGHKLILWTCREDIRKKDLAKWKPRKYLTEAIEWCKSFGLEFDAINKNIQEIEYPEFKFSRKIFSNFYIDDSSVLFNDKNMTINFLKGTLKIE